MPLPGLTWDSRACGRSLPATREAAPQAPSRVAGLTPLPASGRTSGAAAAGREDPAGSLRAGPPEARRCWTEASDVRAEMT